MGSHRATISVLSTDPPSIASTVDDDLFCVDCGYNLRTMLLNANCPECGSTVELSARGFLLRRSSIDYLVRLRKGMSCVLLAIAGVFASALSYVLVWIVALFGPNSDVVINVGTMLFYCSVFGVPAFATLGLFGFWRLASPDPALAPQYRADVSRRLIRVSVLVLAANVFFNVGATFISFTTANPAVYDAILSIFLALACAAAVAVCTLYFASLIRIKWLGARLKSKDIVYSAEAMIWGGPVLAILGAILLFLGPILLLAFYFGVLFSVRSDIADVIAKRQQTKIAPSLTVAA